MSNNQTVREAFTAHLQRAADDLRAGLAPLEDGTMTTRELSPSTGGVWVDTTARDIEGLKESIASIEAVLAKCDRH